MNSIDLSWVRHIPLWSMDSSNFWVGQLLTYQVSHLNFFHLFSNMLVFLVFGPHLELKFGTRFFYLTYFLCGISSGLFHNFLIDGTHPLIGASGSIWGMCVIWGFLKPNYEVRLPLIPIDFRVKYLISFFLALEIFLIFSSYDTDVSHWGHIGGAFMGIVLYSVYYVYTSYKNNGMSWIKQLTLIVTSLLK